MCNKIYVTDNDQEFVENIINNFKNNEVTNGKVIKEEFSEGLKGEEPYDLIIIDCPQYNFNLDLLSQVNVGGRIIYIEKINEELSKAYKMINIKIISLKFFCLMFSLIFISQNKKKGLIFNDKDTHNYYYFIF